MQRLPKPAHRAIPLVVDQWYTSAMSSYMLGNPGGTARDTTRLAATPIWSQMSDATRSWDVLLIGGPSGVGKSSVAYAIARRFGIALTEIDDLFIVAETVTTPASHPALHY